MKTKIAAIGENDIMLIFKAIGVEVYPVNTPVEAEGWVKKLAKEEYGIIFITESIAEKLDSLIKEYSDRFVPSIVVVPGLGDGKDYAINKLRHSIVKAVGVDVIVGKK